MKRITFALFLALNACGTEQQPATRIEYVQEPASDTQAAAVQSAIDANTTTPAAASGPSAVATPTPEQTAAPLPPPTLEANSTPQEANSAAQQVQPIPSPTPSPTPTPTATPACSQTASDGMSNNFACGMWTISEFPSNPAQCRYQQAALWSHAASPNDVIASDGSMTHNGVTYPPVDSINCQQSYVFANGVYGNQVRITCCTTIGPAPND